MKRKSLAKLSADYDAELAKGADYDDALFERLAEHAQPSKNPSLRWVVAAVVLCALSFGYYTVTDYSVELTGTTSGWQHFKSSSNIVHALPGSQVNISENGFQLDAGGLLVQSIGSADDVSLLDKFRYDLRNLFGTNYESINGVRVQNLGTKYIGRLNPETNKADYYIIEGEVEITELTFTAGTRATATTDGYRESSITDFTVLKKLTAIKNFASETGMALVEFFSETIAPKAPGGKVPKPKAKVLTKKKLTRIQVESGSVFLGDVVKETDAELTIRMDGSDFKIPKKTILSRKTVVVEK